jgi:hypothetical protein
MNVPRSRGGFFTSLAGWPAALALAAVTGGAAILVMRRSLSPDVAWFMSVGRRMLAGESLYVQVIDVNPPLISYLVMPPGLIADWLSVSDFLALSLYVLLLAGWSGVACLSLLDTGTVRGFNRGWWVIVLVAAFLILPGYDFGQREHLLVVMSMPYVFLKWRRAAGLPTAGRSALIVGLAAGVGFAIKPFFVTLWLGMEATSHLLRGDRQRWRPRTEAYACASVLGLYAAFALIVHHEYLAMMRSVAGFYREFGVGWRPVAILSLMAILPALPIALAVRGIQRSTFILAALLLVYGMIGAVLAIVQGKGWHYHFLPMLSAVVVLAGLLLEVHVREAVKTDTRGQRGAHMVAMLTVFVGLALLVAASRPEVARMTAQVVVLEKRADTLEQCDASSILVLGETVSEAYPMLNQLGASSASPFPSMWWLRAIYSAPRGEMEINEPAAMGPVEKWFHRLQVERFVRDAPEVVLVDTSMSERFGRQSFPYVEYFGQDEDFAEAWKGYRRAGSVDYLGMWVRLPATDPAPRSGGWNSASVERCAERHAKTRE